MNWLVTSVAAMDTDQRAELNRIGTAEHPILPTSFVRDRLYTGASSSFQPVLDGLPVVPLVGTAGCMFVGDIQILMQD
jgi:hypothetical protein